jgi:hypothetical protein
MQQHEELDSPKILNSIYLAFSNRICKQDNIKRMFVLNHAPSV